MNGKGKKHRAKRGISLIIPVILFFSIMGAALYVAAGKYQHRCLLLLLKI